MKYYNNLFYIGKWSSPSTENYLFKSEDNSQEYF